MKWRKRGLIFSPVGGWSHAQVPTPLVCDGFIRVYFSSRPEPGLSQTCFVDLDADDPAKILYVNPTPILGLGKRGTFDEHGIMPSCAVRNGDEIFLYYSGWSRAVSVPHINSTGLAISGDGGETFEKAGEGPVLGRGLRDPYSATSPMVLKEGDAWHMWYGSGTGWIEIDGKREHTYGIRYARSDDGIAWRPGKMVIEPKSEYEAVTRPYIVEGAGGYQMWFCHRDSFDFRGGFGSYRIGYAWSANLEDWERADERAGIGKSVAGWDSKMVAYPAVVRVGEKMLLFYNGNDFGARGFGYATNVRDESASGRSGEERIR